MKSLLDIQQETQRLEDGIREIVRGHRRRITRE